MEEGRKKIKKEGIDGKCERGGVRLRAFFIATSTLKCLWGMSTGVSPQGINPQIRVNSPILKTLVYTLQRLGSDAERGFGTPVHGHQPLNNCLGDTFIFLPLGELNRIYTP